MPSLTPREAEAIRLYAELGGVKDVAYAMGISYQHTKHHLTSVYRKLDVTNQIEAFRALGWLRTDRGTMNRDMRLRLFLIVLASLAVVVLVFYGR